MSTSATLVSTILQYLKDNNLEAELPVVIQQLEEAWERSQEISVRLAAPLPASEEERLSRALQEQWGKRKVAISVDPSLLSGMVVTFQDTVIDTSGRSKLQSLSQQMTS